MRVAVVVFAALAGLCFLVSANTGSVQQTLFVGCMFLVSLGGAVVTFHATRE